MNEYKARINDNIEVVDTVKTEIQALGYAIYDNDNLNSDSKLLDWLDDIYDKLDEIGAELCDLTNYMDSKNEREV